MTRAEMIDRLLAAEKALTEVMDHIHPVAYPCGSCGHTRYEDFNLKQAAEAIIGAISRVGKARRYINEPRYPTPRAPKTEKTQ